MKNFKTFLVPVDFSEEGRPAVDAAVELAKELGAEIDLIHAYPIPFALTTPYGVSLPEPVLSSLRDSALKQIDDLANEIEARGVKCRRHVESASAVEAIVGKAKTAGTDLIIMGTHGHSGIKRAVLGSVAERVVRHAPCPVMTVKGGDD